MPVSVAVIPVAGHGTRLLPLTKSIPKELLPLGRKPVLQHVVEEMQAAGVVDLVMVTSKDKSAIVQHFSKNQTLEETLRAGNKTAELNSLMFMAQGTRCQFVSQQQQKGLGHAVLCAREAVGNQSFLVALGDARMSDATAIGAKAGDTRAGNATRQPGVAASPTAASAENSASLCRRMNRLFDQHNADAVISFHQVPVENVSRYGIARMQSGYCDGDEVFSLAGLIEKPTVEQAPSRYAVAARYLFKPVIFDYLEHQSPGHGGEIQLTDAVQAMIEDGGKVLGVPLQGQEKRYDVGNFQSYYTAFIETALADSESGGALRTEIEKLLRAEGGH